MAELSHYRKLITMLVTAAIMYVMTRMEITPAYLTMFGITVNDIQEAIVTFLFQAGIPAVFMAAQPNEKGDSIWRWWPWLVIGIAIVAILVIFTIVIGWLF